VLWVAGDGPETPALQARGVDGVTWLGTVSEAEKASRLRGATLACFPSIEGESFGIVLLEAMAAGTPLVASNLTGYRHVARDGREAVLVPPGDPAALASSLAALLDDPGRRDALRAEGQTRAEEFSLARLADRLVERYEFAVTRRARAPVSV